MALSKSAEGEVKYQFQNDMEGFIEDQQGKENQTFSVKMLALHEEKEDSGYSVWAWIGKTRFEMEQGSFLIGISYKNIEAPFGLGLGQANNKELEHEKRKEGKWGMQLFQEQNQNILKIWKRVSQSGERKHSQQVQLMSCWGKGK